MFACLNLKCSVLVTKNKAAFRMCGAEQNFGEFLPRLRVQVTPNQHISSILEDQPCVNPLEEKHPGHGQWDYCFPNGNWLPNLATLLWPSQSLPPKKALNIIDEGAPEHLRALRRGPGQGPTCLSLKCAMMGICNRWIMVKTIAVKGDRCIPNSAFSRYLINLKVSWLCTKYPWALSL